MTETVAVASCCASHKGWPQLTQHLLTCFPDVPLVEIVGIVNQTRHAEAEFGLPDEERLKIGEVIVRHQLMQLSGQSSPPVHLEPESRRRQQ
jgi:hypothetical protein